MGILPFSSPVIFPPFSTTHHFILLNRLESSFRVTGQALNWVRLYRTDQTSFIKADSASSPIVFCNTGVQEASVLEPLLFSLFNAMPLIELISTFGQKFHQYADDTQIYLTVNNENSLQTLLDLWLVLKYLRTLWRFSPTSQRHACSAFVVMFSR